MNKDKILGLVKEYVNSRVKPEDTSVPVSSPYIDADDIANVVSAALDGWFTEKTLAKEFQQKLQNYIGLKNSILCNSGSSSILLAMSACKEVFPKRKYVLTSALAFPTTVFPIIQLGYVPLFIDVDTATLNPNPDEVLTVLDAYKYSIAGVVLTHTLGFPIGKLLTIATECEENGIFFIEDCCLAGDTEVVTSEGDKYIKDIAVGDMVLTRDGYRKVLASEKTGTKQVIHRFGITATPDHPVITTKGIKRLDTLKASDIIYTWNEKRLSIEETRIDDTQTQSKSKGVYTIIDTQKDFLLHYTGKFGLTILGKSLKDFMFITKTITHQTTMLATSNCFLHLNMPVYISNNLGDWKRQQRTLNLLGKPLQRGIKAMKENNFISFLLDILGKTDQLTRRYVKCVVRNIRHIFLRGQKTALENVREEVDVYNLCIENSHEFFANGILVHNCDALGSTYDGKHVGTFGDAMTLSFFPAHHITTGEGGAVLSKSLALMKEVRKFANWGRDCWCIPGDSNTCKRRFDWEFEGLPAGYDHKYTFTRLGYNLKMTELQAALGVSQMDKLKWFVQVRKDNYVYLYSNTPASSIFEFGVTYPHNADPSPFGFPVTVVDTSIDTRKVIQRLEGANIRTRPIFAGNITRQPVMQNVEYEVANYLDGANYVMERVFWIGCHPSLDIGHLNHVIEVFDDIERNGVN